MEKPPENERPVRSMPQTADQESDQCIYDRSCFSFPAASQRKINIGLQKAAESDMPSFPEILNRFCLIGRTEIFRYGNPEHFPDANRHIRIAAEIKIQLQRIKTGDSNPGKTVQRRYIFIAIVYRKRQGIRKQHLFSQSKRELHHTFCEAFRIEAAEGRIPELGNRPRMENDRPGYQGREEGNKAQIIQQPIMRRLPPAPVNEIGQLLKGKKADPQGKQDIFQLKICVEKGIDIFQEEIAVLEITQCTQVPYASNSQSYPAHLRRIFPMQQKADTIIKQTASGNHPKKAYIIISIKPQRHPDQISLRQLILPEAVQQVPACQRKRQK